MERNLTQWLGKHNSGLQYDHLINYSEAANFGDFDKVYGFCHALTWIKDPPGI